MRGTTFTKGKMNYFGSFSQQRTWAPLAQGASVVRSVTKSGFDVVWETCVDLVRPSVQCTTHG